MATQIALLRAVNVAGRSVKMAELKAMFAALGFANTRTLLQSGNVVFDAGARKGSSLEAYLEKETEKRLKLRTDYLVRAPREWKAAITKNPFSREAERDPSHLLLLPMKSAPKKRAVDDLQSAIKGRERVQAVGRDLFAYYPDGIGHSKLTLAVIQNALGTLCTGRNWNTVLKLQALVEEQG